MQIYSKYSCKQIASIISFDILIYLIHEEEPKYQIYIRWCYTTALVRAEMIFIWEEILREETGAWASEDLVGKKISSKSETCIPNSHKAIYIS